MRNEQSNKACKKKGENLPGLDDFSGSEGNLAGVAGALCTDPGLGVGLEFSLDGRTWPSAEFVRDGFDATPDTLFGLFDGGTSEPDASDAGFGVIDVGGSEIGTVVPPLFNGDETVCKFTGTLSGA